MADEHADDLVQEILAEVARRKRLWDQIQAAGKEAVNAVQRVAKKRGLRDGRWFGPNGTGIFINAHVARSTGKDLMVFKLYYSGEVRYNRDFYREPLYDGYCDFGETSPDDFRQEAVDTLMEQLFCYLDKHPPKKTKKAK